jgi:PadR family transcriptional regulator PadR
MGTERSVFHPGPEFFSNKGRIHLRRPTCQFTFRLRQSGGPYIPCSASFGSYLEKVVGGFKAEAQLTQKGSFGHHKYVLSFYAMPTGKAPEPKRSEVLQGTLDLMVLKTLETMGLLHGYGIARRIEQLSEDVLQLNEGTVYTSLLRLQQQGWISAAWGVSENNRKAKFYSITKGGRKQLLQETENWERISGVVGRVLKFATQR